jgi:signal transduction histidine kinase
MWNDLISILSIASITLSTGAIILVYLSNRKSSINVLISLVIFCGTMWASLIQLTVITGSFFVAKLPFIFGTFFPAIFIIFIRTFSGIPTNKKFYYKLLIPATIIIAISMWDKLLFPDVIIKNGAITTSHPGPMMIVTQIYQIIYFFLISYTVWRANRLLTKGTKSIQVKYIFAGYLTCYVLSILVTSILPIFFDIYSFDNLGPIFLLFLSGSMVYVATKHHIIEVKVVFSEIWTFFLVLMVFSAFWINRDLLNLIILLIAVGVGILLVRSVLSESAQNQMLYQQNIKLEKDKKDLETLNHLKVEFLQMAFKELSLPVKTIRTILSSITAAESSNFSGEQKETLKPILVASDRLSQILNNLFGALFLDNSSIWLNKSQTDIGELIGKAIENHKKIAQERNINLEWLKQDGGDLKVKVDREKIYQVIYHLIQNALNFTYDGEIIIESKSNSDAVLISVTDTGIGISQEDQKQLFTKFFHAAVNENLPQTHRGIGLGLYISKKIIELHGGSIKVESEIGRGSKFTISLPREKK